MKFVIKQNVIIGCIYQHPYMDPVFNSLLENIATGNKKLFLVGDFNIDLFKVDIESPTTMYLIL